MDLHQLMVAPQIGEFVWHQVTADASVNTISDHHLATMRTLLPQVGTHARPLRVLELGAYRHYSGHALAAQTGAEVWLSDISADALRAGSRAALAAGIPARAQLCAADFHDLPFADGYFDLAFIASAVHHTRRPEQVLSELLRVLRPGGLLWLDNEPVGREACFYQFNSNRPESYTEFETRLAERDLSRLLSSPFPGTRPEEMFCMVENDRIPLDLYLSTLTDGGRIESLTLATSSTIAAPERRLIEAARRATGQAARVAALRRELHALLDPVGAPDAIAQVLGFTLPTAADVLRVARRVAHELADVEAPDEHRLARTFGAALQARVRRRADAPAGQTPLKRPLRQVEDCWIDVAGESGAAFLGMRALLPDVHDPAQRDRVTAAFDPAHWGLVEESFGAHSLYNLAATATLPALANLSSAILLMRVYTVPDRRGPYLLRIRQGHRVVAEGLVAQAESRLLRGLIHGDGGAIVLEHTDLDGRALDIAHNLRIGVLQYVAAA